MMSLLALLVLLIGTSAAMHNDMYHDNQEDRMEVTSPPKILSPRQPKRNEYEYYELLEDGEEEEDIKMEELTAEDVKRMQQEEQNAIEEKMDKEQEVQQQQVQEKVPSKEVHADTYKQGPSGFNDRFGMLADMAGIPGIQLDKDVLMKLDPEVLERLIATLASSGLASPTATAYESPPPTAQVVEKMDTCPDTDAKGIKYYCKDMPDGLYYDPWNPWCGYIKCSGAMVKRKTCSQGAWMDMRKMIGLGQKDLCQLPLSTIDEAKACNMYSDMYMCKNAERIAVAENNVEQ